MAWRPDLELKASWCFALAIIALHGLVAWSLHLVGWNGLIPLVIAIGGYQGLQAGFKYLPWSPCRVWLTSAGWHLQYRNGRRAGPFELGSASRLDLAFIRLSLRDAHHRRQRHLLLTRSIIGADDFRRLQQFLRWAPDKNQPV